uniref:Uncharacterized protein n=1 Tax=Timema poppense TaxID=170557 RepID=A0A7R9GZW2_TIMPO|nr:unnamed protein product [Timema poppensis]
MSIVSHISVSRYQNSTEKNQIQIRTKYSTLSNIKLAILISLPSSFTNSNIEIIDYQPCFRPKNSNTETCCHRRPNYNQIRKRKYKLRRYNFAKHDRL